MKLKPQYHLHEHSKKMKYLGVSLTHMYKFYMRKTTKKIKRKTEAHGLSRLPMFIQQSTKKFR